MYSLPIFYERQVIQLAIISGGKVIEGSTGPYLNAGAPVAGTDEIQTLTIGGTPTGGTFKLAFEGAITAAITWTATDATLVANIDAALGAINTIGAATNITTAAGTVTSGIGTITLTFVAAMGKKAIGSLITVSDNSLTGSAPTLAIAETTPGVDATARGIAVGGLVIDTTNAFAYINTGTSAAPTFTKVGTQS